MSDYLWDRSGEPDEEIKKLEEVLAPLGYQPRPLEIPATVAPEHRRKVFPALAIAATIALAALALGLWLTINRHLPVQPQEARQPETQNPDKQIALPQPPPEKSPEVAGGIKRQSDEVLRYTPDHVARRREQSKSNNRLLDPKTIIARKAEAEATEAEAEATKEQLIVALRLVSTKLNHAQKRAQGDHSENPIRYQHRVG